jgi:4-alpha-glucanotransferase
MDPRSWRKAIPPARLHQTSFRLDERAAGVLLHPTSLAGPAGCGDLGPAAYKFVDFLAAAGQRWWQVLPVGPPGPGNSPYSSPSAFAGSLLLVSLEQLAEDKLLPSEHLRAAQVCGEGPANYPLARQIRRKYLREAFENFLRCGGFRHSAFVRFCDENRYWLEDFALFSALHRKLGARPWTQWPPELRRRQASALRKAQAALQKELAFQRFVQFEFQRQWENLKGYANRSGVALLGDVPMFVAHDSADVWAHPELFRLRADGRPQVVSGVPPDYFSRNGQLWGHPHYRWQVHRATGFAWWIQRLKRSFELFDAVRLDHFLGFYRVWEVPGGAKTARRGVWRKTPGRELLKSAKLALGNLPIVAEDLGVVTPQALALRDEFGFPGMRLLHFAFGSGPGARYNQPHCYPRNCVVYPGTHDNETTVAWFERLRREALTRRRCGQSTAYERLLLYLGHTPQEIHWEIIRLAYMSVANLAIIPAQDLLGLGAEARMNFPGRSRGNWQWRAPAGAFDEKLARRLYELADTYGRLARD